MMARAQHSLCERRRRSAREKITEVLIDAAARAKAKMAALHAEPACLLDFWARQINAEIDEAHAKGEEPPAYASNRAMAETTMDFLFASQDASTAALVWCLHYLSEHPAVLARVRAEQERVRANNAPLTYEVMEQLVYTRQVVKEILRIRPPPVRPRSLRVRRWWPLACWGRLPSARRGCVRRHCTEVCVPFGGSCVVLPHGCPRVWHAISHTPCSPWCRTLRAVT
jgi:hypothetical protein